MAETRGRRDGQPMKTRPQDRDGGDVARAPSGAEPAPPPPAYQDDRFGGGFDEETNSRYEEIKRGTTHISELQQMTMPQLLKTAKDENIPESTGLKKQDLIF